MFQLLVLLRQYQRNNQKTYSFISSIIMNILIKMPNEYTGIEQQIPEQIDPDILSSSEIMKMIKELINDEIVEERLKDFPLWSIGTKSLKLTFLDYRDKYVLENLFEAEVCKMLRTTPKFMHTPQLYSSLGQARMVMLLNTKRSVGTTNRNLINERTANVTQIKQVISSSARPQTGGSGGKLRRIFGLG